MMRLNLFFGFVFTAVLSVVMLQSTRADAQFAGDFFFTDPSVTTQVNNTVNMQVSFFTAAEAFGIAHAQLVYDPNELEVVSVSLPPQATELQQFTESTAAGAMDIIVVNPLSTTEPIGTVLFADLVLRPKIGTAGTVQVSLTHKAAFSADATVYGNSNSPNGEIVVTTSNVASAFLLPGAALNPDNNVLENPSPELTARAAALAPPGGIVELVIASGPDAGKSVLVQVPAAPGVASD